MNKIICKLCRDDKFVIDGKYIDLNIDDDKVFTYNFWEKIPKIPNFISNVGLDIFYLSLFVYGIDRSISREEADDCWSRNFKLYVPVLELEKWEANKELFQNMLNFLSGDFWEVEFRSRILTENEKKCKNKIPLSNNNKIYDTVCMFSGGLDSFIGAIDILEADKVSTLFVSHYGGGKGTREYQDLLRQELTKQYNVIDADFCGFYAAAKNGIEDTTRTRSFMFFAHAIALATSMGQTTNLIIPENGLISLNIPLTSSRLGTSSTRTTHPYYLGLLQKLLLNMKCDIKIVNPYQFLTKGEMIEKCRNSVFLITNLHNTMSCSHPDLGRMQGETEACHCGYCLPCVIRKAAIKRALVIDNSNYRDDKFLLGGISKINFNSYLLGIAKFQEKYAFLTIQKSGPIRSNIIQYTDLYIRGMNELKSYLEEFDE